MGANPEMMETAMRSSDLSGAEGEALGARGAGMGRARPGPAPTLRSLRTDRPLSVTLAVALTAFLAATLFTVVEAARAVEAMRAPAEAAAPRDAAPLAFAASFTRAPSPAENPAPGAVLSAIAPGALGAYALALLATAATLRRRRPARTRELDALIDAVPFGIAHWRPDGAMSACNPRFRDSLGTPAPLRHAEALRRLTRDAEVRPLSRDPDTRIFEVERPGGPALLIEERRLETGGLVTLVTDVTEKKRADALLASVREEQRQLARRYHEEKLRAEAASLSKTNFLAHLSHDIRTPLNHIIGFADLIGHETYGPVGDARYLDYVSNIKASGERLLESFATILDLAEFEGGRKALRCEPVQVDGLLETLARRFSAQAGRAGIRLSLSGTCGVTLSGDRFCLTRMLANVIENALRFTPSGGSVTLAAFAAHDGVVIEVSDTGIGMGEDRLDSLFQPFALGDASLTRDGAGHGLGIPIARAIAELSGGRMAIDSSPALGTTVAFSLPLRHTEPEARQAA